MTRNTQIETELAVFSGFVKSSDQPINLLSIQSCKPPAPDIKCQYIDGTGVAFEIVEILDMDFKRNFELQISKTEALYNHISNMCDNKRLFENHYHNADITVAYKEGLTKNKLLSLVPLVFKELLGLPANFEGFVSTFKINEVNRMVDSISIMRGRFNGPLFNPSAIGWIEDPSIDTVKGKLMKKYETDLPIELLAYIDFNPMLPEEYWKPELDSFLSSLPNLSPFRKIWVFDFVKKRIVYSEEN